MKDSGGWQSYYVKLINKSVFNVNLEFYFEKKNFFEKKASFVYD